LIFVRETSDSLTSLVKKMDSVVDAAAAKATRPPGAYVIFVNDSDGMDKELRDIAEKESIKRVSLCIGAPPDDYEVNKDANVTVVIYKVGQRREEKVTANFALRKGELDDAKVDAIVKALAEALPK
jgi:hypothetical protein